MESTRGVKLGAIKCPQKSQNVVEFSRDYCHLVHIKHARSMDIYYHQHPSYNQYIVLQSILQMDTLY